jgi:hypothetical protein
MIVRAHLRIEKGSGEMALDIREETGSNLVTVTVTGKLVKEDYARFVPQFEAPLKRVGKVRILFVMKDFHGWALGGVWEDIKFDMHHFADIEKLAMVGDAKWKQWMASFCKPFTTAQIKYFDTAQLDAAREWLGWSPSSPPETS